jgi:hypothetical protein
MSAGLSFSQDNAKELLHYRSRLGERFGITTLAVHLRQQLRFCRACSGALPRQRLGDFKRCLIACHRAGRFSGYVTTLSLDTDREQLLSARARIHASEFWSPGAAKRLDTIAQRRSVRTGLRCTTWRGGQIRQAPITSSPARCPRIVRKAHSSALLCSRTDGHDSAGSLICVRSQIR